MLSCSVVNVVADSALFFMESAFSILDKRGELKASNFCVSEFVYVLCLYSTYINLKAHNKNICP